jgi:hypothetical protein
MILSFPIKVHIHPIYLGILIFMRSRIGSSHRHHDKTMMFRILFQELTFLKKKMEEPQYS